MRFRSASSTTLHATMAAMGMRIADIESGSNMVCSEGEMAFRKWHRGDTDDQFRVVGAAGLCQPGSWALLVGRAWDSPHAPKC